MHTRRRATILALLGLLLSGLARPPGVGAVGGWTPTAARPAVPNGTAAAPAIATTLADGRVLITGSYSAPNGRPSGAAEIYDPAADRWTTAAAFDPNRGRATPILLLDGRVLFSGGVNLGGASPGSMRGLATAQTYDPATDTWAAVAPMRSPRRDHTATLLPDGTVLVVSGDAGSPFYSPSPVVGVERYDPQADRWTPVAPLDHARFGHGVALLRDGRVLVFGGYGDATAAIYDPAADRWAPAAGLPAGARGDYAQRAIALPDGRVLALALGGHELAPTLSVYDPAADRWALAPPPPPATRAFSPLPGGRLLAIGQDTRIYDPAPNAWAGAPPPADPGAPQPTDPPVSPATPLGDGRVLLVGARGGQIYADDPAPRACFAETGQCVAGHFLNYWRANGGLARNGFPLSGERSEVLEDGNAYQVQYFERVRLEYHPENPPPYDVLLGQFGRRVLRETEGLAPPAGAPAAPHPGQAFFPETGHTVAPDFLAYWEANGGLAQFGFPLTEEFAQRLEGGNEYAVQYFERARLERHPENALPYDILLGQFGRRILTENDWLAGQPGLRRLYVASEIVQARLGSPGTPYGAIPRPRSYQSFERGALIWWGEAAPPSIIALCDGTPQVGNTVRVYPDTWAEGQPVGGGPGPGPGLYEPARGFGKLWRENQAVRACLGYATDPGETGYVGQDHPFARGETRLAVTPTGRFIYALYGGTSSQPCYINPMPACRYERYPDPTP